jgi:hypothetical protein
MIAHPTSNFKLYPQVSIIRGDEAFDADGNQVQYDLQAVTTQAEKDDCKAQRKSQVSGIATGVCFLDVQITNKADFDNYRAICRGYVIRPVTNPTSPPEPHTYLGIIHGINNQCFNIVWCRYFA